MPNVSYIFWDAKTGGLKPDPRLPDILCAGTREEIERTLPIAMLISNGPKYAPGYCVGVYSPLPKKRRRSPESIAATRRKAIEKRAAEKGGLFGDFLLEQMLKENADRLDPEKIRKEQERIDRYLKEKDVQPEALMTPQQAALFLIRLPVPFICDWIDVWQEYRRTRVWTPRMQGYVANLKDPAERARQASIKKHMFAFGKEKSEGELLKMLKL